MKIALVTGANGQDGSYLTEYLLELNYEVHGTVRAKDRFNGNLHNVLGKAQFHYADLRDTSSLEKVIRRVHPDEIYNLAGQVFVPTSWTQPADTFDANVGGLARILSIVEKVCPAARVYQASTSEMYGNALNTTGYGSRPEQLVRLDESVKMCPVSPYGVSKYAAHKLVEVYRQKGLYAVSGILGNHESPRRGAEMVTRKITRHIARWKMGDETVLRLGNPASKRDWGFAGDYVKAMHAMLQPDTPDDYTIGTGKAHSVKEFIDLALEFAGIESPKIMYDCPEFSRQNEVRTLVLDSTKAQSMLGWTPQCSFPELVKMMVEADCHRLAKVEPKLEAVML